MSCQSAIFTVNTNVNVNADSTIPVGTVIRRYGKCCQLDGTGISLVGSGYFSVDCSIVFTPTTTGPMTFGIYQDGAPSPGTTKTVNGTASEATSVCIPTLIRNCGCKSSSTITVYSDVAGVADVTVRAEKK